jgi:hypothetical protein
MRKNRHVFHVLPGKRRAAKTSTNGVIVGDKRGRSFENLMPEGQAHGIAREHGLWSTGYGDPPPGGALLVRDRVLGIDRSARLDDFPRDRRADPLTKSPTLVSQSHRYLMFTRTVPLPSGNNRALRHTKEIMAIRHSRASVKIVMTVSLT